MKKLLAVLSALVLVATAGIAEAAPRAAKHHHAKSTHMAKAHTGKKAGKKLHAKSTRHAKKARLHRRA